MLDFCRSIISEFERPWRCIECQSLEGNWSYGWAELAICEQNPARSPSMEDQPGQRREIIQDITRCAATFKGSVDGFVYATFLAADDHELELLKISIDLSMDNCNDLFI
jgi:hypothetical protein